MTLWSRGSTLHGLSICRHHDGVEVEAVRVLYDDDLARIRPIVYGIIAAAPIGEDGIPWLECLRLRAGPGCDFYRVESVASSA